MQILIENGFMQASFDGSWTCKRLLAYAVGDEVKVRKHNEFTEWEIVHNNDPVGLQKLLDEMFKDTEEEQTHLLDYAAGVERVCNENNFPVRHVQRAGIVEFFYNGQQTYITDPVFLFSIDLKHDEEFLFSSPDCSVYAEDNPIEIELPEVFEVMHTETNFDRHSSANLYNRVYAFNKTNVYANMTHALRECLLYGVANIGHQVAQIKVEDDHHTQLVMHILRETKFPEVHAYAVSFLSENFNGSN